MRLPSLVSSLTLFSVDNKDEQRRINHHPCHSLSRSATTSLAASISSSSSSIDISLEEESTRKYDDLIDWLCSKGATVSSKLQIRPSSRGGGYGVFVIDPVQADEILFTVPRSACVTLTDAMADASCGKTFQRLVEKAGPGGNTVVLAGFLTRERLNSLWDVEQGKDLRTSSLYGPYLATLPWERSINNQEHMLFWSDQDVDTYLRGSMGYSEALSLREEVALAIKVLNAIVGKSIREHRGEALDSGFRWPWEARPEEPPQQGMIGGLSEAVTGAFVCLLTRSFQDGDKDDEKLVPMLDMLQHSDIPNVSHVMRKEDGTVVVSARQSIAAGDELLNQYRPELEETMPYHRFFTRFGFVPGVQEPIQNLLRDKSSIFFAQKAEV